MNPPVWSALSASPVRPDSARTFVAAEVGSPKSHRGDERNRAESTIGGTLRLDCDCLMAQSWPLLA
jgi:hypothetical protein